MLGEEEEEVVVDVVHALEGVILAGAEANGGPRDSPGPCMLPVGGAVEVTHVDVAPQARILPRGAAPGAAHPRGAPL